MFSFLWLLDTLFCYTENCEVCKYLNVQESPVCWHDVLSPYWFYCNGRAELCTLDDTLHYFWIFYFSVVCLFSLKQTHVDWKNMASCVTIVSIHGSFLICVILLPHWNIQIPFFLLPTHLNEIFSTWTSLKLISEDWTLDSSSKLLIDLDQNFPIIMEENSQSFFSIFFKWI